MRLVFIVLLTSLFSEFLANPAFAQDSPEPATDLPPTEAIDRPETENPPVAGEKIPTQEDKVKRFCEIEENKDSAICRTSGSN